MRHLLVVSMILAAMTLAPAAARATVSPDPPPALIFGITGLVLITIPSVLVFGIATATYGADDSYLPPAWASAELAVGAVGNALVGSLLLSLIGAHGVDREQEQTFAILGGTTLLLAVGLLVHSIICLNGYEPPAPEPAVPQPYVPPELQPLPPRAW